MKIFLTIFFIFNSLNFPIYAQEDVWSYTNDNLHPGEEVSLNVNDLKKEEKSSNVEENDPWESVNRVIFDFNDIVDQVFLERISQMYKGVVPEVIREHIGYVLRNLSEPIVLTNNILQGEMGDAEDTLRRFLINSTVGLAGIFDVSTSLDIPYKKEDFGLTLASWGFSAGPYLVLPILGPSNVRDTFGRIGDYSFDPINWWAYTQGQEVYSNTRTAVQLVDAKTDNLEVVETIKKGAIDEYATFRAWYNERRESLISKNKRPALDTPRPDDED